MLTSIAKVTGFGFIFGSAMALSVACGGGDSVFDGNGGSGAGLSDEDCQEAGQTCNDVCDPTLGCVDCLTDADCGGGEPVCVAGECVECGENADCPMGESCFPEEGTCEDPCTGPGDCEGDAPICDTVTGACVGCQNDADCGGEEPLCSPTTKQCGECNTNADCGAGAPYCDEGDCEQCLVDGHCGAGDLCIDDECRPGCTVDTDCTNATEPRCDTQRSTCVECLGPSDCGGETPVCSPGGECVVCNGPMDCAAPTPFCDEREACVECLEDEDCGNVELECAQGSCVPAN